MKTPARNGCCTRLGASMVFSTRRKSTRARKTRTPTNEGRDAVAGGRRASKGGQSIEALSTSVARILGKRGRLPPEGDACPSALKVSVLRWKRRQQECNHACRTGDVGRSEGGCGRPDRGFDGGARGLTDTKERLLIFSDSRQDAAHQARFIVFASRYDRMRRRLVELLESEGALTIQRAVELLGDRGAAEQDNPKAPPREERIYPETRDSIRAWEEAPLLDELAVNAGYRNTLVNLGLVGVGYSDLAAQVITAGSELRGRLGVGEDQFVHLCRCVLDEMRARAPSLASSFVTIHSILLAPPTRALRSGNAALSPQWAMPLGCRHARHFP